MSRAGRTTLDGVALALYQSLFAACAEEMGVTLMRTAHSPNIKERLDHSCAVFDARGRLVAQAAHIPVHLGSLPRAVEAALAVGPLVPGDVVLLNDPYAGGTHLPDLTLVSPVFLPRGRRGAAAAPDFVVASRAHHADIGGAAPGSMPLAREVYEEGLRLPPVFLVRGGRLQRDVLHLVLANVRTPDERRADLAAQLGAQATGERRLLDLARREAAGRGPGLARAAAALMDYAERRVRAELRRLPRGQFRFADALDDDGLGHGPVRIAVTLTLAGGRVRADFSGSDAQTPGPVNAVEAVTRAATYYAVRCVLGGDLPVNDGTFRPIEVVAPAGTVVNPMPPAAVAAGNVETSQRIVDVVLGAFARALPARIPAASYGTMSNLLIGGADPRSGRPFAYYETLAGGAGGGPAGPGASGIHTHMTNTMNTPIEALEAYHPLRIRRYALRPRSGGRGLHPGGCGIVREIEFTAPAEVTLLGERREVAPWGLAGGSAGRCGRDVVVRKGRARVLPAKVTLSVESGDRVRIETPGGGGFGRRPRRRR